MVHLLRSKKEEQLAPALSLLTSCPLRGHGSQKQSWGTHYCQLTGSSLPEPQVGSLFSGLPPPLQLTLDLTSLSTQWRWLKFNLRRLSHGPTSVPPEGAFPPFYSNRRGKWGRLVQGILFRLPGRSGEGFEFSRAPQTMKLFFKCEKRPEMPDQLLCTAAQTKGLCVYSQGTSHPFTPGRG